MHFSGRSLYMEWLTFLQVSGFLLLFEEQVLDVRVGSYDPYTCFLKQTFFIDREVSLHLYFDLSFLQQLNITLHM